MWMITQRNIRLFFRNKRGVASSLVAALIVILLYVFFLGDNMKKSLQEAGDVDILIHLWIMAGFISVASMTSTLGAISISIRDKENGILRDFICSPLKSYQITAGYLVSAYIIGVIMTFATYLMALVYLLANGGTLPDMSTLILTMGAMLLSVGASTAILFFLVTLFHTMETFETASSIIGPLAGFITGIYIPMGSLPLILQNIIKCFPLSHGTALLRQVMMQQELHEKLGHLPSDLHRLFQEQLGITFYINDTPLPAWIHVLVLLATTLLFYGLAILVMKRKRA